MSLDCSCLVEYIICLGCYCIKCCRQRYAVLCETLQKAARSLANIAFSEQEPLFEYFCTWWFLRAVSVTQHWYVHMPDRPLYVLGLFMPCRIYNMPRLLLYQMLPASLCCLVRNTAEGSTQSGKHSIQRTGTAFWVLLYLVILAGRVGDTSLIHAYAWRTTLYPGIDTMRHVFHCALVSHDFKYFWTTFWHGIMLDTKTVASTVGVEILGNPVVIQKLLVHDSPWYCAGTHMQSIWTRM